MALSHTDADSPTEAVGAPARVQIDIEDFGRYAVLETVGSGGMGTVRRAYDPKLRREVALKVLRADRVLEGGTARMVREAQAMAQLSHPNVVAVFDVEETDRGVLIAMEYVAGRTMSRWLKDDDPTPAQILSAFVAAGRGLVAAHRAGLVHRDFKPSNVLVGEDNVVKVTDFGLAKAVGDASTESALSSGDDLGDITVVGTVVGTPRYMAPEQHRGDPPSAAADQYSFCLSLWESLFRVRLHAGKLDDLVQSKLDGPPALPPGRPLPTRLLEAIRRGLQPAPSKRWPDMAALLAALDEAPARSRRGLALAGVAAVGLSAAAVYVTSDREDPCDSGPAQFASVWNDDVRAAAKSSLVAAAPFALDSWPDVERKLDDYAQRWLAAYRDACEATHVRHEQSAAALDLRMGCLERRRRGAAATVTILSKADGDVAQRAHELVGGLPPLSSCTDIEALQRDVPPPDDPALQPEIDAIEGELTRVDSLFAVKKHAEALELAQALRERALAIDYAPTRVDTTQRTGTALDLSGRGDEGVPLLRSALDLALEQQLWGKASWTGVAMARALIDEEAALPKAEVYAELALSLALAADPGGPLEANAADVLARVRILQGQYEPARSRFEQALAIRRDLDPESVAVARTMRALGMIDSRLGRYEEAAASFEETLALAAKIRGSRHPVVADLLEAQAVLAGRQLDYDKAVPLFEEALSINAEAFGEETRDVATNRINLATALRGQKKWEEARTQLEEARRVLEAKMGPEHQHVAEVHHSLANLLTDMGKLPESTEHLRRAVEIFEKVTGKDNLDLALFRYNLADLLLRQDQSAEARDLLELAADVRTRKKSPPHFLGDTFLLLARALDNLGEDPDRARQLVQRALDLYAEAKVDRASRIKQAKAFLAQPR